MTRPMVTVGVGFLTATFVASFFRGFSIVFCYIAILFVLIGLFVYRNKCNRATSLVIVFSIFMGITCFWAKERFEYQPIMQLNEQTVLITGVVTKQYQNAKGTNVYEVSVQKAEGYATAKFQTKLYSNFPILVEEYDTIQVEVTFQAITNTTVYDAQIANQAKELYIIGFIKQEPIAVSSPKVRPLSYSLQRLNNKLCDKADQLLPQPTSSMIKAMLLGNQKDIDAVIERVLVRAGVIHIVSISGMHITFLAGFLFWLLKLFRLPNWLNSLIGIVVIWVFVALVNFQIATVRSAIMITVLLAGNLFGRSADHVNSLFLAGVFLVLWNPFAIYSVSFQLTFLATLGVLLCVKPIRNWVQSRWGITNRFLLSLIESVACTLGATLFILPVLVKTFHGISVISPIANIIAVLLTPIMMISGILLLIIGFIPFLSPISIVLAEWVDLLHTVFMQAETLLQKVSFAFIGTNYRLPKTWLWISVVVIFIVWAICWVKRMSRKRAIILKCAAFSVVGFVAILLYNIVGEQQDCKFTTLTSYDSQAIVITYQSKATVITYQTDGYLLRSVADFLDSKNIDCIETLILLEKNTRIKQDIDYLSQTKQINTLMLYPENQLIDFIKRNQASNPQLLLLDKNYRVQADNWMRYECILQGESNLILLSIGNIKIGITNDKQIAQSKGLEVLYFSQKNIERIEQFSPKYVILLNRREKQKNQRMNRVFYANENKIEFTIKKNGTYRLRK